MTTITPHAGKEGFHPLIGHTEGPSQTVVERRQRRYTPVEHFTQAAATVLGLSTFFGAAKLATDQGARTAVVSEAQQFTHNVQELVAPGQTTQSLKEPTGSGVKPGSTETATSNELLNASLIRLGQDYFNGTPNWVTASTGEIYTGPDGKPLTAGEIYQTPQTGDAYMIDKVIGGEQVDSHTAIVLVPTYDSKGEKVILVVQLDTVKYGNPFWTGSDLIPGRDGPLDNGKSFQYLITQNNSTTPDKFGRNGRLATIYLGDQTSPAYVKNLINNGTVQQGVIRTPEELASLALTDISTTDTSTPTPTSSSRGVTGGANSDASSSLNVLTGNYIIVPDAIGSF